MTDLKNLSQITDELLGGLTAGQNLKHRILQKAAGVETSAPSHSSRKKGFRFTPVIAACGALALAVGIGVWALPINGHVPITANDPNNLFDSLPAGQQTAEPAVKGLLDLAQDSVSLNAAADVPSYRSIWAPQNGGNFPLIGVNGEYYRLLRSPSKVSNSLLGSSLGEIDEYTDEPSLSSSSLLSNVVAQGETVYPISGMDGAMVAAKVEGTMRAFQRVTYAGNATIGSEDLSDTLGISGQVVSIELSDVGTISDKKVAASLAQTLLSNASYKSASATGGQQSLLLKLDNGLTVQMLVKNGVLSACGSWTCPEFFEEFEASLK